MDWTGVYEIIQSLEEFKAVSMSPYDFGFEGSNNKHLTLTVHATQQPTVDLYVYSPYWLINKTDLVIQVKVREFGEDLLNHDQRFSNTRIKETVAPAGNGGVVILFRMILLL